MKLWIGLNDIGQEGTYRWSDGSPVNFTSYQLLEPNDHGGWEDCTEFLSTGLWNDIDCEALMPYVCKTHNSKLVVWVSNLLLRLHREIALAFKPFTPLGSATVTDKISSHFIFWVKRY